MATYGDLKVSTLNGGMLSGFRNAIINGNFGINQRGVSGTVSLAAGAYGHDRWKAGASGCTYTFATSENVTTLTIAAGSLIQVVEGLNLMTGTYTLSWEGTAQGKIGAGSYGNSGITGSVTGGTNLNIEFGTGTLRLVHLEKGSVATPFEFRSIGQELALCQRYFSMSFPQGVAPATGSADYVYQTATAISSTACLGVGDRFPVEMRTTPSVTFYPSDSASGATGTASYFVSSAWSNKSVVLHSSTSATRFAMDCTAGGFTTNAATLVQYNYVASAEL